ncbi:MFS transporter [Glutamicibacter mysorens]|uniref:MFS transporter n=1 Tax=Glutamicibacter mysorens TaxID=257984 RepID=UPI0020C6C647|nr:MFS transporter [Glutamicibacter mysorens]UTM45749.1 MFS transporter [Glutamicibacter mysorens]
MSASSTAQPPHLKLPDFIDKRRLSGAQILTVCLCFTVMFLDGFDTQSINYMAPAIAEDWGLDKAALGPIFSSALVGLMIGYLLVAPLSDRFGHKKMVIIGVAIFALSTLASVWAADVPMLIALRLITGIGLGAATPSTIALTAENSPRKFRASFVLAIYCGFSLGFIAANYAANMLIPEHGWRSVFLVGAVAPLVLIIFLLWKLPESLNFLVLHGRSAQAYALCRRIDRQLPALAGPVIEMEAIDRGKRTKVTDLLVGKRLLGTVLLWVVFAINLALFYGLQSWIPTLLSERGYESTTLATAASMTTLGGILIVFIVGPAMDRVGAFGTLGVLYFCGGGFLVLLGFVLDTSAGLVLAAIFLVGCVSSGGQKSVIALASVYYPAEVRSTGVGWALGIGRIGGIAGPMILGAAFTAGMSAETVFTWLAVPTALCGAIVFYLGKRAKKESSVAEEATGGAAAPSAASAK